MQQYIGFSINSNQYMISILAVREIISMPSITQLPHLPPYVRGITNLRDTIIPVINIKYLLNGVCGEGEGKTIIVVASGQVIFGIIVDAITGVVKVDENQIEPPESFVNKNSESIAGVAKIEGRLIVLLDIKKLLPLDDLTLLEDTIVNIEESEDGNSVEVTRQVNTIGGKVEIKELHNAEDYLSEKRKSDDPNSRIYDMMLQVMDALTKGDYSRVEDITDELAKATDSNIFKEVGKITRKLHDSLEDFKGAIDSGLQKLTENDVPNAVDKLQFVISKTEDAANKTMAIVEQYFEEDGDFKKHIDNIEGHDEDKAYLTAFKDALDNSMTEILTAQQFQDITGQTIKKVINLVNSVENELLNLITSFGMTGNPASNIKPERKGYDEYAEESGGHKPAAKIEQADVESLLNDFGF